jgi:hypothetical protein
LWRPPLNLEIQELIRSTNVQPTWDALLPDLQRVGQVVDLTYAREIDGSPVRFKDPVHSANAPQILQSLLATKPHEARAF